jgi:glycosyltransferase involved in cell wall biosynthesis
MPETANVRDVNVFVLLGHDFGANSWERKFALGLIPGLNDRLAYGYFRASGPGWVIEYSHDCDEGSLTRAGRLALRKLLGFDLIHIYRNRRRMLAADIVWTHTELEHLAVLALCRVLGYKPRPKLIANCVWLFDQWPRLSPVRRLLYRSLLRHSDVVTTHSPENLRVARELLPSVRCECLFVGTLTHEMKTPRKTAVHRPVHIVSLGSDMHRDWDTLLKAFGNIERYKVRIGSSKIDRKLVAGLRNITIVPAVVMNDVKELYEWADFVVIPLKPNLHVSGITVIFESIVSAVPVICTDTGGLRAYFPDGELAYVPTFAPRAMREAVDELSRDDACRFDMLIKAQKQLIAADLTSAKYAERHRQLSEELLRVSPKQGLKEGLGLRSKDKAHTEVSKTPMAAD